MGNLEKLTKEAKREYKTSYAAHDWNHILRVKENTVLIAKAEGADKNIVLPAAILHDLGRRGAGEKTHSSNTQLAGRLLQEANYAKEEQDAVLSCIRTHSAEGKGRPASLEAQVLFDADKLDSYGFVGVARFFVMCGEKNQGIEESAKKAVKKIIALDKAGGFYTKTGEKLGFRKAKRAFLFYYFLCNELGLKKEKAQLESILFKKFGKIKAGLLLKTATKMLGQ